MIYRLIFIAQQPAGRPLPYSNFEIIMYVFIPIAFAALIVFFAYWLYRKYHLQQYMKQQLAAAHQSQYPMDFPLQHLNVEFLDVRNRKFFISIQMISSLAWGKE